VNAAGSLLAANLTPQRSGRIYLRTPERDYSYDEVAMLSDAAGAGLLAAGLRTGDRVLLATGDCVEFVATFWGAIKAGLVVAPFAQRTPADDLAFIVRDSGARALVRDHVSAAASAGADLSGLVVLDVGSTWTDVCTPGASLDESDREPEDIALWLYTSGTTGRPKAVMHSHRSLAAAPLGFAEHVVGLEPGDIVFSSSRFTFTYGLVNGVVLPTVAGASVIVDPNPAVFVREGLERTRPTIWCGFPSLFASLVKQDAVPLPETLRFIRSAGERLPVELFERFRDVYGREIINGLGVTEALHVSCNRPGAVVPASVGAPVPPCEVQVRGEAGSAGELWVRTPTAFSGYWGDPALTARMFDGEWMRTGDLVRIEDGLLYHEGRLGDMVKIGAEWVSPSEVEDVLRSHPDVHDAAVVPTEGKHGVTTLTAYVATERNGGALASELQRLCRSRLPLAKVPASFEVVDELPRSDAGKLQRFRLRQ